MPSSDTVMDYIPLVSIEKATEKYREYGEKQNVMPVFIEDLVKRKIIPSRNFANIPYVHPVMFENWLINHHNKQGRPFQNEGYMDKVDVRKHLEETEKYSNVNEKDVVVLFENNLLGTPIYLEKKTPYVLNSSVVDFCKHDKLFCHVDIVNLVHKYITDNFGTISVDISEVVGFDINNEGSLIKRNYIRAKYFSDSEINNSYFATKEQVDDCMDKLEQLIQHNAKIKRQQLIQEDFDFRFRAELQHKALLVNRLKPFSPPSKEQRWKYRKQLQDKFDVIENLKTFLNNEIEHLTINTDLKMFISEITSLIPNTYHHKIYTDMSGLHINKVQIPFDKEMEIYEEVLLDEKKIF